MTNKRYYDDLPLALAARQRIGDTTVSNVTVRIEAGK